VSTDASNDAFVFHPELVLFAGQPGAAPIHDQWRIRRAASATGYEAREDFVFAEMPHDVPAIHDAALARQHRAHPLPRSRSVLKPRLDFYSTMPARDIAYPGWHI